MHIHRFVHRCIVMHEFIWGGGYLLHDVEKLFRVNLCVVHPKKSYALLF